MKCYAINLKTLEVKAYVNKKVAQGMGNGSALFTNMEELCGNENMSTERILSAFNHNSENVVKRFSDRKTGIKRLFNLVEHTPITHTYWDSGEYNPKVSSQMYAQRAKQEKTPQVEALPGMTPLGKTPHGTTIRTSTKARGAFAGKKIKCLIDTNPRKEGTRGWNNFSLFLGHGTISYEEFVELAAGHGSTKGGCREDLAHDIKKGRVELIDA